MTAHGQGAAPGRHRAKSSNRSLVDSRVVGSAIPLGVELREFEEGGAGLLLSRT